MNNDQFIVLAFINNHPPCSPVVVDPQECVFNRLYSRPRLVVSWRRVNIGERLLTEAVLALGSSS